MSARLKSLARQNREITERGGYTAPGGSWVALDGRVDAAVRGTRVYGPEPVAVSPAGGAATVFEVTGEDSLAAARRLTEAGPSRVGVLNFASARNVGGGYVNGARAQEEDVCRASALYECLLSVPEFYTAHRADPSPFYSDRVIHSPAVPVFRDRRGGLLDAPYGVDFLTAAAPNAGVIARQTPERTGEIPGALLRRAGRVLEAAAAGGCRELVLGAWGCGVFRNEPAVVAGAFAALLLDGGRCAGWFERVVFAVWERAEAAPARGAFEERFAVARA
ncbi:TIGR02452 family protein [Streptomyces sp. NPDC051940]|uniref:TIGR02452 family protein n=1 Tax=Streptomyces sp. NPDC051940 TaxID=3155675 RepID=UPI003426155A